MWRTIDSKDVRLPVQLQRAMAAEAEASREARAKVIAAEGEFKASTALKEASMVIAESPAALQLRYLQVCVCLFFCFFKFSARQLDRCSNDYLVQRALCADSEHHFGREEFDHHFPTAHRFPDSVYEINRLRRFVPTRNPIGRTHSADKRKQHFSRATLTRYKNMCVDV